MTLDASIPREPNGRKSRRSGSTLGRPRIEPDKLANGQPEIRFRVSREVMQRIRAYVAGIEGLCVAVFAKDSLMSVLYGVEKDAEEIDRVVDLDEIGGRR